MYRLVLIALIAFLPRAAGAVTLLPDCTQSGNCGISDILAVLLNVVEYGLGLIGAIALVYFMYGGFMFILAAGASDKVKQGKAIIIQATIGIVIVFTSGVIVRFATTALTGQQSSVCGGPLDPATGQGKTPGGQPCTAIIGGICVAPKADAKSGVTAVSIWVSLPAGKDKKEGLECIKNDNCKNLNEKLHNDRGFAENLYTCIPTNASNAKSCVRGLCGGKPADYACCLTK